MVNTPAQGTVRIARRRAPSVDIPHILLVFLYVEILQVANE
jgi:hypothetical protein